MRSEDIILKRVQRRISKKLDDFALDNSVDTSTKMVDYLCLMEMSGDISAYISTLASNGNTVIGFVIPQMPDKWHLIECGLTPSSIIS